MYSAESAIFIGTTKDRAYLEYTTAITFFRKGPDTIICWINLDDLPKNVSDKIKAGEPPWVPFNHKN